MKVYTELFIFSSDVSGGYHPSVLSALRMAVSVSKALQFGRKEENNINHHEAFFMATLGGAQGMNAITV